MEFEQIRDQIKNQFDDEWMLYKSLRPPKPHTQFPPNLWGSTMVACIQYIDQVLNAAAVNMYPKLLSLQPTIEVDENDLDGVINFVKLRDNSTNNPSYLFSNDTCICTDTTSPSPQLSS